MDISAGSVCVNKAAVSISCSCLADSVYSAVSVQIVQNSNSDQVILWWVSIALCECDFDNNVSNIKSSIVSKNQNINNERHKKVFAVK